MERLHAHGPYKGTNPQGYSGYVSGKVSKKTCFFIETSYEKKTPINNDSRYNNDGEIEEVHNTNNNNKKRKGSNAVEMPETFGNASSSTAAASNNRHGSYSHHNSSSDSNRHKKYR